MGIDWWESDPSLQKLDGSDGNGTGSSSARTRSCASGSSASSARWSPPSELTGSCCGPTASFPPSATPSATPPASRAARSRPGRGTARACWCPAGAATRSSAPSRCARTSTTSSGSSASRASTRRCSTQVLAGRRPSSRCGSARSSPIATGRGTMLEREREPLVDALGAPRRAPGMGGEAAGRWRPAGSDCGAGREPAHGEGGAAYLARRRRERQTREAARALAAQLVDEVDGALREHAVDAVAPAPRRTGSSPATPGDMLLNAAYLLDADEVDALRAHGGELQERHAEHGARISCHRSVAALQLRRRRSGAATGVSSTLAEQDVALVDLLDRLLGGGVVIAGDITLAGRRRRPRARQPARADQLGRRSWRRRRSNDRALRDHARRRAAAAGSPASDCRPAPAWRRSSRPVEDQEVDARRRCGATRSSSRR